MALGHLEIDLRLDLLFDGALRDEVREAVFDFGDRVEVLAGLRETIERRILEYEPLQCEDALRE